MTFFEEYRVIIKYRVNRWGEEIEHQRFNTFSLKKEAFKWTNETIIDLEAEGYYVKSVSIKMELELEQY